MGDCGARWTRGYRRGSRGPVLRSTSNLRGEAFELGEGRERSGSRVVEKECREGTAGGSGL